MHRRNAIRRPFSSSTEKKKLLTSEKRRKVKPGDYESLDDTSSDLMKKVKGNLPLWDLVKDALSFSRRKDDVQATMGLSKGEIQAQSSARAILRALAGNIFIASLKFAAWWATRSSAMLAEAIHTFVDAGNQALLLLGSRQATQGPDSIHPYGYGKAAFFWSLVSALGMFWLGAGITISHGVYTLLHPMDSLEITWHTWAVLSTSFIVDFAVLQATLRDLMDQKPDDISLFKYIQNLKDPLVLAVILEDVVATSGVLVAGLGIGLTELTGNVLYDGLASITVGGMLGFVALSLVRLNQRFLMGLAVDTEIQKNISNMLLHRPSIEAVSRVLSLSLSLSFSLFLSLSLSFCFSLSLSFSLFLFLSYLCMYFGLSLSPSLSLPLCF